MKRLLILCGFLTAFMVVVSAARAQKASFAGTWLLDQTKSQILWPSIEGADKVTWIITQEDKSISIQQMVEGSKPPPGNMGGGTRVTDAGPRASDTPESYTLDGQEKTSDITFRGNTGKLMTKGTASGNTLELIRKTTFTTQEGAERVNITTKKLSLSGDGETLTAVVHTEGRRGPTDSTLVFNRQ